MGKFKAVIFKKDELEYRDTSILKALLPLLAQDFDSRVGNKFHDFETYS